MEDNINVAFVGNPNCGKTTLFNAYTGARLKVANWPGVTVEKKEGVTRFHERNFKLVDLPGIYSLTSYTMEERLSRQYILEDNVDVIVDVVDASSLERNLYLAVQLIELGKPVVLALNMMDIVEKRGMEIDLHRLPETLGIPAVPVSARKRTGLKSLMHAVEHHRNKTVENIDRHYKRGAHIHDHHSEYVVVYSDEIEDKIDIIISMLTKKYSDIINPRWYAIKILEMDEEIMEKYPLDLEGIITRSYESDIINQRYDFIEEVIREVLVNKKEKSEITDKADRLLTHPILGLPIFLLIMGIVFALTFTLGDYLKGFLENWIEAFETAVKNGLININAGAVLTSLIVDGIIAGVGGILTFLPNIAILFLSLAFLEDSGYMSRVAYIMDGIMSGLGLSGRAFIPLLLGFGCSVPAIMASRALENKKDRLKTILITPFMSCSARLPIYVFLSDMFFGKYAIIAAYSMYIIGVVIAILTALVASKIDGSRKDVANALLIELPEYKAPGMYSIMIYVWEKIKDYLERAGTIILTSSIILWALLNFGPGGMTENIGESFGAMIGKGLVPVMSVAGLGQWRLVLSLISGVAAKEVVVSSMSVLYGADSSAEFASILAGSGFTAVNAYSMMLFCLLYVPCIATIATIRRETQSLKFTVFAVAIQIAVAWTASAIFYQTARLLGY